MSIRTGTLGSMERTVGTFMIHLNAYTQPCPVSQATGQWKNPNDKMSRGYVDIDYWVDLARMLERGRIDALFMADIHGIYDIYAGSRDATLRQSIQTPCVDPMLIISAMAAATKNLGFASTYSTTFHAPYECARAFTSLDHLTKGRVGWNVVTSYVKNAEYNGLGTMLPHDERYERAEEFMEVVYRLWEESWDDDAVVRDVANDTHTDPSKVHSIDHVGEYFSVEGPLMCEPSIQRTPVLYQAGASPRGLKFGAKHAEAIFFGGSATLDGTREKVDSFRELVASSGRDPNSVKLLQPVSTVVGETEADAKRKYEDTLQYASPEGHLALFGGWTGIDLAGYDLDTPLENVDSDGMRAIASRMKGRTVRQLLDSRFQSRIIGDPAQVVDKLEELVDCGLDGFIMIPVLYPQSYLELVDMIVPELQSRGLFRTEYETETLREHYFGKGMPRTRSDHPSARFRDQHHSQEPVEAASHGD